MSVRPLPYLEWRCKTGPTCHRRAMTGLLWAQLFPATFRQQNLPFFSRLKNDTSTGAESLRGAQAPPLPPPTPPPSLAGFRVQVLFCQSTITTTDVSLSKTQTEARRHLNEVSNFNKCAISPAFPRGMREDPGLSWNGTRYQHAIPRDTKACRPLPCDREHQQQHAHASAWDCADAHQRAKLRNVAEGWRHFQVHPHARKRDPNICLAQTSQRCGAFSELLWH